MSFLQTLYIILAFGAILFLVVVFTKYLGSKAKRTISGQFINIIESIPLGMDKQIHLLKVGDRFILIATAGKSVVYLTTVELDSSKVEETQAKSEGIFDFKGFLDKYLQNFKTKKAEKANDRNDSGEFGNDAGGDVFKINLDKLRSITSKMAKEDEKDRGKDIDG